MVLSLPLESIFPFIGLFLAVATTPLSKY